MHSSVDYLWIGKNGFAIYMDSQNYLHCPQLVEYTTHEKCHPQIVDSTFDKAFV